ncbi:MAG: PspC domain-containing protein, partial [Bacteroidetes bacterium]|nr:PspC domain-containing protein [Bacteroidota bacterium]
MKKTVTVNISGAIFHIDEDAFDKLNIYLNTIRNYFSSSEGRDEILGDIEARIAEMLREKIVDNKQVITIEDIEKVISIMGEPEQVAGEDAKKGGNKSHEPITSKRFYRDPDNSILGGVCGGIAAYFNIKSMWVRIAFILFSLAYGSGFLIYLLLWIIIPKALTTAEKLEMKGEKINISNIEKSINEEITQIKSKFSDLKDEAKGVYARNKEIPKNTFEKILMIFFQILKYFIKTVAIFVGIIFIVVGIFLITGFIFSFFKTDDIVYISSMGVSSFSIPVFLKILLTSSSQITLAMIGLSLLIGIPLLMLIYNGTKLIFGFRTKFRFVGLSSFSLWLTGLVLCGIVALQVTRSFSHKYVKTQTVNLIQPIKNTLYLDLKPDNSIDSLKSYD